MAIPVKVYPATKDQTVRFNLIHAKCGNRVQNQWFCPVNNEVMPREDLVRGAQVGTDQYVQITDEELEALDAEANRSIDLKEFVPLESVDPVYCENSYFLGGDKGGEKPYRLVADALEKTKRVAVAELVSSGKEQAGAHPGPIRADSSCTPPTMLTRCVISARSTRASRKD